MVLIEALLFFILGIFFGICIINVFDSLGKLLCTILESITANLSIKIAKANKQIQDIGNLQEHNTMAIGFSIPSEEEEYYEEDE